MEANAPMMKLQAPSRTPSLLTRPVTNNLPGARATQPTVTSYSGSTYVLNPPPLHSHHSHVTQPAALPLLPEATSHYPTIHSFTPFSIHPTHSLPHRSCTLTSSPPQTTDVAQPPRRTLPRMRGRLPHGIHRPARRPACPPRTRRRA